MVIYEASILPVNFHKKCRQIIALAIVWKSYLASSILRLQKRLKLFQLLFIFFQELSVPKI